MPTPKIPSVYAGNPTTNTKQISEKYASMAGCSQEQIMTPINIPKEPEAGSPLPGFRPPAQVDQLSNGAFEEKHVGPTNKELNPYFGLGVKTDFQIALHNESFDDLNMQTKEYDDIDSVRTMAFRGPLLLSGWGYDLADQPVPIDGSVIDTECADDRALWKTGPVDLKWDDERQVWSGGPHIVEGILTSKITQASSVDDPTTFTVSLRRGKDWENKSETITCSNRDTSLKVEKFTNVFVIAIRINYEWRPLWIGCP